MSTVLTGCSLGSIAGRFIKIGTENSRNAPPITNIAPAVEAHSAWTYFCAQSSRHSQGLPGYWTIASRVSAVIFVLARVQTIDAIPAPINSKAMVNPTAICSAFVVPAMTFRNVAIPIAAPGTANASPNKIRNPECSLLTECPIVAGMFHSHVPPLFAKRLAMIVEQGHILDQSRDPLDNW